MIKTIIVPQSESYTLAIPKKYIGKKLEVLFYATDELIDEILFWVRNLLISLARYLLMKVKIFIIILINPEKNGTEVFD